MRRRWLCWVLAPTLALAGLIVGALLAGGHFAIRLTSQDLANLEKILASITTAVGAGVAVWRYLRRRRHRRRRQAREELERQEAADAKRAYEDARREDREQPGGQ